MIKTLKDIDTSTKEGRMCFCLLAKITTEFHTDKTPNEVIEMANKYIPDDLL